MNKLEEVDRLVDEGYDYNSAWYLVYGDIPDCDTTNPDEKDYDGYYDIDPDAEVGFEPVMTIGKYRVSTNMLLLMKDKIYADIVKQEAKYEMENKLPPCEVEEQTIWALADYFEVEYEDIEEALEWC